jgi:hypothetical protein
MLHWAWVPDCLEKAGPDIPKVPLLLCVLRLLARVQRNTL